MRIVTLGVPVPSAEVDNHSIANAPSLFEYDACIVDMRSVSEQIEAIAAGGTAFKTAAGVPVRPGATTAWHVGLGDLLTLRREELQRFLDRGGLIVVLAYPNVPHASVETLPGATRYSILPAAPGVAYRPPQLLPGDGSGVVARDPHHSFTPYLADLGRKLRYRAYWNPEAIPEFAAVGRVIGMSTGGAAAAVEFVVGPGRMIFLPPPERDLKGTERRPFTDALLESVERALERPDDESAPAWAKKYDLPGAAEAERHSKAAETAFAEAEASLVEARAFLADARRFQALLWRGGRFGLEPVVREAFRTLGFDVAPDLDQDDRPARNRCVPGDGQGAGLPHAATAD